MVAGRALRQLVVRCSGFDIDRRLGDCDDADPTVNPNASSPNKDCSEPVIIGP
jgi:hypothetical protein